MDESRARPLDRVMGGYLAISALVLAVHHQPSTWPVLLLGHVVLTVLLLADGLAPLRRFAAIGRGGTGEPSGRTPWIGAARKLVRFVVEWYPLILLPFLYWELQILNGMVWGAYPHDALVQRWDLAVFGGQPSVTFSRDHPSMLLSELLHASYLSYYPVLYLFPAVLYAKGRLEAFRSTLFVMMLAFTTHYLVYVFFPVKGPYFLFPAPGEPMSAGAMYAAVHYVLANGASAGTAFPSSHVALTTVQTTNAFRHMRWVTPIMALCVLGIVFGAVYAGVHYAIDVVVGLGTGLLMGFLGPRIRRWLL